MADRHLGRVFAYTVRRPAAGRLPEAAAALGLRPQWMDYSDRSRQAASFDRLYAEAEQSADGPGLTVLAWAGAADLLLTGPMCVADAVAILTFLVRSVEQPGQPLPALHPRPAAAGAGSWSAGPVTREVADFRHLAGAAAAGDIADAATAAGLPQPELLPDAGLDVLAELRQRGRTGPPLYAYQTGCMLVIDADPAAGDGVAEAAADRFLAELQRRARPAAGIVDVAAEPAVAYEEPATGDERLLAEVWAQVLAGARAGRRDSLLRLGGTSMDAVRATALAREAFAADVPLWVMFAGLDLAGTAAELRRAIDGPSGLRS